MGKRERRRKGGGALGSHKLLSPGAGKGEKKSQPTSAAVPKKDYTVRRQERRGKEGVLSAVWKKVFLFRGKGRVSSNEKGKKPTNAS